MTIEEKIRRSEELFQNYYLIEESESIKISSRVLEENGLGGKEFWDLICPLLKKRGVLRSYSYISFIDSDENFANPEEAKNLSNAISYAMDKINGIYGENIFFARPFQMLGRTEEERLASEKRIKEAEKKLEELIAKRNSLERMHPFEIDSARLIKELSITKGDEDNTKTDHKPSFDEGRGILSISDKTIGFRKFTEQYHVLRIIFADSDLTKEWFFSDISEQIDRTKRYTDKQFHNYLSAIKRRVAAETGIRDLFITTTQSVKINGKYLKKI